MTVSNPTSAADRYHTRFDPSTDDVIYQILTLVASSHETTVDNLPSLYGAADPDALQTLVSAENGPVADRLTVTFEYADRTVIVENDGHITIVDHH